MRYLAVIPARGGSKGLKDKNLRPLGSVPLICWSIQQAIKSDICDVVFTTDSQKMIDVVKKENYPIHIIHRPSFLADDEVPITPVVIHACQQQEKPYEAVIILQPTSPLRIAEDIVNAVEIFEKTNADSLLSVCEEHHSVWDRTDFGVVALKTRLLNRQQEAPIYIANGAIFITKWDVLLQTCQRLYGHIELYVMPHERSVDIHTIDDLKLAEWRLGGR